VITTAITAVNWLRGLFPQSSREAFYRFASAVTATLLAIGITTADRAALWGQLAVAGVTLLFALLYATSAWRAALYGVLGPLGSLLMAYGIVDNVRWALIVAALAQIFGITTAAAKTVQLAPRQYAILAPKEAASGDDPGAPAPPDSTV
jgi:hypothetical protein